MTLTSCYNIFKKSKTLQVVIDPTSATAPNNNADDPTDSSDTLEEAIVVSPLLSSLTEGYCFFKSDSEQYCWGDGATGEVGSGLNSISAVSVKLNL